MFFFAKACSFLDSALSSIALLACYVQRRFLSIHALAGGTLQEHRCFVDCRTPQSIGLSPELNRTCDAALMESKVGCNQRRRAGQIFAVAMLHSQWGRGKMYTSSQMCL